MSEARRFHALDSFRGVCALSVVVFHMHIVGTFTELTIFRNADVFVEFFFVLSGFVLSHAYTSNRAFSVRNYVVARTFRIVPLHWCVLGVFILLEVGRLYAFQRGFEFNIAPFTGPTALAELIPNFLLIQAWLPSANALSFNYPSWSISVEYYMYMLFAGTLVVGVTLRNFIWLALAGISFFMLFFFDGATASPGLRGLSCFFAGAISYTVFNVIQARVVKNYKVMSVVEVVALLVALALVFNKSDEHALYSSLSFCLVAIVFAFDGGLVSKILQCKLPVLLGKLSYSIYLTHAIVLFCFISVVMVIQKLFGFVASPVISGVRYLDAGNWALNNILALAVVMTVVVLSMWTYKYIEIGGQRLGRRLLTVPSPRLPNANA